MATDTKIEVVYKQMWLKGLRGRIVRVKGKLVAQVEKTAETWERASTRQAASLFRNAYAQTLLRPGDPVVAWDGSRLVRGFFVGPFIDEFEVALGGYRQNFMTAHVLPVAIAQCEGIWPFRHGMQVAAYVDEKWVKATWECFEDGMHQVRLSDSSVVDSPRAHIAADAIALGLVE